MLTFVESSTWVRQVAPWTRSLMHYGALAAVHEHRGIVFKNPDPIRGSMIIIDPWIPEDQLAQTFRVLGWSVFGKGEGLVVMCDKPFGWDGAGHGTVALLTPRMADHSFSTNRRLIVDAVLVRPEEAKGLQFMAEVEMTQVVNRF